MSDREIVPLLNLQFTVDYAAKALAWLLALIFSAPSIWAMLTTFNALDALPTTKEQRRPQGAARIASTILTFSLVGMLSAEFFPAKIAVAVTTGLCAVVLFLFRGQLEGYYLWMEQQFHSGFQADLAVLPTNQNISPLAIWDAHLVEVEVPPKSFVVAHSLIDLQIRERFGINIVVILRDTETMISPMPSEVLFPKDRLLCFGTDAEIDRFRTALETRSADRASFQYPVSYSLRRLLVHSISPLKDQTIRQSGIREKFSCTVVGIEREIQKIKNPHSDLQLVHNDIIWVVGEDENLQQFIDHFS